MDSFASLFLAPKSDKTQLFVRLSFFIFPLYFQVSYILSHASTIISTWSKYKGYFLNNAYNLGVYVAILTPVAYILSKMYLIFRIRYSWIYTVIICVACVLDMCIYWILLCGTTSAVSFTIPGLGRPTTFGNSPLFGCDKINPGIGNMIIHSIQDIHNWMQPIIFVITTFLLILDMSSNNKCVTITTS